MQAGTRTTTLVSVHYSLNFRCQSPQQQFFFSYFDYTAIGEKQYPVHGDASVQGNDTAVGFIHDCKLSTRFGN